MKSEWMMMLTAALFAVVVGCTAHDSGGSTPVGSGANGQDNPPANGGDPSGGGDVGAGDDGSEVTTTPAELVGTSFTWVTSSGGQTLAFPAADHYKSDVLVDSHPGESCGIEYSTHREGIATFSDDMLLLTSNASTRTKTDTCKHTELSKETIDEEIVTYTWRLEKDDKGPSALLLTTTDGNEWRYERD
jgi:hypothetical protein